MRTYTHKKSQNRANLAYTKKPGEKTARLNEKVKCCR